MTAPVVSDRSQSNSGNATLHPADMPTHVAGEVIFIPFGWDGSPTPTVDEGFSGTGWNLALPPDAPHASATPMIAIAWKIAESSSEVLRFSTGATSEASANMGWSIDAGDNPVVYIEFAQGSSSNPDPPNIAPAAGSQDYIILTGFARDNQATASAGPSGYSNFRTEPGVSSGGVSMAVAEKTVTASSENPGVFTVGVEQWWTFTAAIYDDTSGGVDTIPPTMNGAIEVTAYTEGGTGYSIAWPAATDNVAVTGYELSLNNGGSWADLGDVLTYDRTGGTVGATDQIRVRAYDAAANVAATPLSLDLLVGGRFLNAISIPLKGEANSNVQVHFTGTDIPPRTNMLITGWGKLRVATGFYGMWWTVSQNSGGTMPANDYFSGYHPYPCDGVVDTDGTAANTGGSTGTQHFWEIAGMPNRDYIESNTADTAIELVENTWTNYAIKVQEVGANTVHTFWPDIQNNPDDYLQLTIPTADIDAVSLTSPALVFGAAFWQTSGSNANEPAGGEHLGWRIFDLTVNDMSVADIQAEGAAAWEQTNAPGSSAGATAVWYINDAPSSTDVLDNSGEGHDPAYATAYLPSDYEEIVESAQSPTATGQTLTVAASLIPGNASAVRSPTQDGVTMTAAASLIAGLATGQTNITADGVLVSAAASLITGAASGVQNPTAAGQTLVAAASLIPGAASGVQSPTAAGQVLTAAASLIAGAASSGTSGTADGATMVAAASLVAGSASGVRNATAPGATMTAGASLVAGSASAVRSPTQAGVTLSAAASLVPGAADGVRSPTAAGVTLSAAASLIAGAASADNGAVAPGALFTAGASLLPGAASAVRNAEAFGAFLELLTTFLPGDALTVRVPDGYDELSIADPVVHLSIASTVMQLSIAESRAALSIASPETYLSIAE